MRLELPPGASRKPAGSNQPLICLLSAAAFSHLPQAGPVGHADTPRLQWGSMVDTKQRGSTCEKEAALVGAHVQHDKCALVLLLMSLVLWHTCALNKRLLEAARST
jgi:hypothetical protein